MSISISFFSNYFNVHQLPASLYLSALSDVRYTFVSVQKREGQVGRPCLDEQYPFVVRAYLGGNDASRALQHALEDDIVVFGDMAGEESYVRRRQKTGKPFFRYSERILKRGDWWAFLPPKRYRTYDRFTRYTSSPMFVLCSSGFTSRDLAKFGFPPDRCLKWGYFPQIDPIPFEPRCVSFSKSVTLSSAQRLVSLKRVDLQVSLAVRLKELGIPFVLKIAGEGPDGAALREMAIRRGVSDQIKFVGTLNRKETLSLMRSSDIFLATSNRKEGWGSTVNEAMASGCAVVASSLVGSTPFLIRNGDDGVIFRSGDLRSLELAVVGLIEDPERLCGIAKSGYEKITTLWSAETAASRFVELSERILSGRSFAEFAEGPLSLAPIVEKDWFL